MSTARQLEGAGLRRVALEQPGPFEIREMGMDGLRRREADRLADLANGRRVAVAIDVLRQEAPDLLLPAGQFHFVS
jgi:hypothetical protein